MKVVTRTKQLEIDFTCNNNILSSKRNVLKVNTRKTLTIRHIKDRQKKELLNYIIQNEKSF